MFHQEADRIATPAATKTFIELFGRGDSKGGSLLIMKRTEAKIVAASAFQLNELPDYVDDIEPSKYLLYRSLRDHSGPARY